MHIHRRIEHLTAPYLALELPPAFANRRVEILVLTLDEAPQAPRKRRAPPPQFAGKVKELGDVVASVPLADWNLPE